MGWSGKKRRVVKRIYEEVEVQEFSEEVGLANGRQLEVFNDDNGDLCVQVRSRKLCLETPPTYYSSKLDNETVRHLSVILQKYVEGLEEQQHDHE